MVSNEPAAIARYCAGFDQVTSGGKYHNPHKPGTHDFADHFEGAADALKLQLLEIKAGRMVCTPTRAEG